MNALVLDKMRFVQMCAVRSALSLEILGMKRSRSPSAYVIAKREFGCTGKREACLLQLNEKIEEEHNLQKELYANVHPIK